ncbi:DUF2835 family protein [Bowmanella sp. JS7-9]|uniref:DUF2835 family protein n=1 Tax=Pseudobowmanella zhangzhouensis TaxID=1537679 RepID=A0ABW1XMV6_9ALTE|nr:DUF2835 family protein [Bowmanella sp. JS7-9]TBX26061.1 hypothetical protein TK45_02360 [Bowmanella sp. JS7-9]
MYNEYFFRLDVSYYDCQRLYAGNIPSVILTDERGRRIQIATRYLRNYISSNGIHGRFRLQTDNNHKFVSFLKIT